jgi:hypothetical protein
MGRRRVDVADSSPALAVRANPRHRKKRRERRFDGIPGVYRPGARRAP